jgi:hypothetical protein
MGRENSNDKHLPFFKLVDACREGGCHAKYLEGLHDGLLRGLFGGTPS